MATKLEQTAQAEVKKPIFEKHATPLKHVFFADVNDNGQLREIAVVKEWDNGSIAYIDIVNLDNIDRGRILKILKSPHADKYALWELMDQTVLSGNGKNALDYFHQLVKLKKAPGHVDGLMGSGGSLFDPSLKPEGDGYLTAASSDPTSGVFDSRPGSVL